MAAWHCHTRPLAAALFAVVALTTVTDAVPPLSPERHEPGAPYPASVEDGATALSLAGTLDRLGYGRLT
ncbi:hypothetical protein [Streptomyces sp. NPDC013187]|uniref:hypothetical protein n=1 Tax=Streptomyces sp. NPDC013187 TaxID=3364865 RepID=UPI0036973F15